MALKSELVALKRSGEDAEDAEDDGLIIEKKVTPQSLFVY
jgi:hypothetical protein